MDDPELLAEVPMFQSLALSERTRLAAFMKEEKLPKGRVLFEVGDAGSSLYIIGGGKIKISVPGDSGEEVVLATLGGGEFFGELALLDGNPRSARATAAEDATLYSLERDNFMAFVGQTPDAALSMLSATAKRLRHTDELMRSRASFDVNEEFRKHETRGGRWADRLASLAGSWGFIYTYFAFIAGWIVLNLIARSRGGDGFDSGMYEMLGLILGVIASLQAPIIMMSQGRDQIRDRIRADADFKVNLKNEVAIEKALERLDELRRTLPDIRRQIVQSETVLRKHAENLSRVSGPHDADVDGDDEDGGAVVGEGTTIVRVTDRRRIANEPVGTGSGSGSGSGSGAIGSGSASGAGPVEEVVGEGTVKGAPAPAALAPLDDPKAVAEAMRAHRAK